MELKEKLERYKDITLKIIEYIEKDIDNYNDLERLIQNRQDIIKDINFMSFSKDEFKDLCNQYSILFHEEQLMNIIEKTKADLKTKINKTIKAKNINNYNNTNIKAVFLSREV